jgi:hypothetical protein
MYPTVVVTDLPDHRDRFRSSVAALAPGPLRDVLTAVAYARDGAARTGATTPSDDRWRAVVTAAERAMVTATERAIQETTPSVLRLAA